MRGSWRPNRTAIFWPHSYGHQRCVFLILLMLNRRPRDSLCWLSLLHLISNFSGPQLIRGSKGPFGLVWPSLPHLVYNSSDLQLSPTVWLLSWLSYIIVQCPLNRLLDLWNGMFDHHQAEITVMQFRGHSLPVYQSMSASWDFLPCPISSAKHAHAISFDYWPLECVTSFRCITL